MVQRQRWLSTAALLVAALAGPAFAATPTGSGTVTVGVPNTAANGPYQLNTESNGFRGAGTGCSISGSTTYNVEQGTSQTINFNYPSKICLIGGSLDDQFLASGNGCQVTATSGVAPTNPVNSSTITSITFAPTTAVCAQFTSNNVGVLSFIAFDASTAVADQAYACKFTVTLNLVPEAASNVNPSQLFPQADAADALPGSFLKMLGMAVLGGGLMLFMLL